ncbi:SUKH-4 family immunity protein [Streptomyces sp. NPDC018833]|uniref:SUKH-4 family immunity protein n=1 Tax=Streptomyces sp. NPDC018833 TaxID=3365053 RepID=UPI0037A3BBFA
MIAAFGLDGVVFFPRPTGESSEFPESAQFFLSSTGLPNDYFFLSAGVSTSPGDAVHVGPWADSEDFDFDVPDVCRSWLRVGYFPCSIAALDPADGRIYGFSHDGDGQPVLIHRDLDSLVRSLLVLKKFCEEREENEDIAPDELRRRIEAFDRLPFADAKSEWNAMLQEIEDGIF